MSCPVAQQDGAYVLGALSPAERLEFEQHLAGCSDCRRAVGELAGLPGLLTRVDPAVLESPPGAEPVPDTLLPSLVAGVRRSQRRRVLTTAGIAVAAVAAVVVPLVTWGGLSSDRTPAVEPPSAASTPTPPGRAMEPVGDAPVRASVAFAEVPWGTRLDLTCTYAPAPDQYGLPHVATYVLLIRTRDGRAQQVGTWRSLEGKTMSLTAATSASRRNIASVEVQTTDGRPVLRLTA